jgi:hypothetical protein
VLGDGISSVVGAAIEEAYCAIKGDSLQIRRKGDKYERDFLVGGV